MDSRDWCDRVFRRLTPADRPFAAAFVILFCLLTAVRLLFRIRYHDLARRLVNRSEGTGNIAARWALGSLLLVATAAYLATPGRLGWMFVPVPACARAVAVGVGLAALALLVWTHLTLKEEFTSTLALRSDHRLITTGPYRYVRHPMYSAYFALFLAAGTFTRSWLIGGLGISVIGTLMTTRLAREEAMLQKRFGLLYVEYASNTGRFLPRLRAKAPRPDPL